MNPYTFACEAVVEAGERLLIAREKGFTVDYKGGNPKDIVTSIDHEINDFLIAEIQKAFPEHRIYSEESEGIKHDSLSTWTIDPIDGSANFSRGIPHFAVCLGLLVNGISELGAIYNPVARELFSFERGRGAFLNGKPLHVSEVAELRDAFVFLHAGRRPEVSAWGGESYRRLLGAVKKTSNLGSSSLDACFVAAGRIEGNIYGTLSTLDISPALGLLKEAGGAIRDRDGKEIIYSTEPEMIFMANSESMATALRELLA